jgi:hypothetical protein
MRVDEGTAVGFSGHSSGGFSQFATRGLEYCCCFPTSGKDNGCP